MHENTIELLREESLRLLQVEIDLLQRMKDAEGVVVDEMADEHQTFSLASINKYLQMLSGEASKLERLEMVLAVVGTMKAGKSTTINAIVGSEVLPNRNRPMTALPTRIRHTPGQTEPLLRLENSAPINALLKQLRKALAGPEGEPVRTQYAYDKDMSALLQLVEGSGRFERDHKGPQAIFEFLRSLNDLVRLAQALAVEFPFASYSSIDDIPVIEVEFAHLANLPGTAGNLTLLDTPGPNEAGQEHLRHMLREQLLNASAVLAVLDFTQLKSDADQQVRQELENIADVAQGRIFALVNKFDEKNRNSDNAEQTKTLVAESLLKGRIDSSRVFPVSSKLGDLANRAQRELVANGRLPETKSGVNAWVEDFGKAALGTMWEMGINNTEMVKQAADMLWKASLFAEPLNNVIAKAHNQAAIMAVASAAAKLADISGKLNNFLNIREVALGKNVDELLAQINSLRSDIERIDELERQTDADTKDALKNIEEKMKGAFERIRQKINYEISEGFTAAKKTEKKQAQKHAENWGQPGFPGIFNLFFGQAVGQTKSSSRKSGNKFGRDFDEKNPIISLNSRDDADEVIKKIEEGVQEIIATNEKELVNDSEQILNVFRDTFNKDISTQASTIIGGLNQRLNGSGFSIEIKMPRTLTLSMEEGRGELLRGVIESKQRNVTRRRRSTGLWGSICGFFDTDDWGWESYSTTEGYYQVDINKVKGSIDKTISTLFDGLDRAMTEKIKMPLEESVKQFFDELKLAVESLRSDLAQSIRDKQTSQEQQKALTERLTEFKRQVPGLKHDSEALKRDVQPASSEVMA